MEKPEKTAVTMAKEGFREQTPGGFIETGESPRQILDAMKTEEREREQIRRMRQDSPPPPPKSIAEGTYEGAGGYKYEVMPGGAIKIVGAPGDRGLGVTLKAGHPAHAAISEELEAASPMDPGFSPESQGLMDTLVAMEKSGDKRQDEKEQATGVRSKEGRSGEEFARVQGLSNEEQIAELDRDRPGKPDLLDADAMAALERVKARTSKM
jgi:hypothetical protein